MVLQDTSRPTTTRDGSLRIGRDPIGHTNDIVFHSKKCYHHDSVFLCASCVMPGLLVLMNKGSCCSAWSPGFHVSSSALDFFSMKSIATKQRENRLLLQGCCLIVRKSRRLQMIDDHLTVLTLSRLGRLCLTLYTIAFVKQHDRRR